MRWALEEAGFPYDVRLINSDQQKSPEYRHQQPFGQVPVLEDGDLTLFESGSILLYIAEKSPVLWPSDPHDQARTRSWIFTALNSIEPFIMNLSQIDLFSKGEEWAKLRREGAVRDLKNRLELLSRAMEGREYLEKQFTVADLLLTTVLQIPRDTNIIQEFPRLDEFRLRNESRPAFQKALKSQLADFEKNKPPQMGST